MLARLGQGTLRYVGGQLSHEGAATHGRYGTKVTDHFGVLTIHNDAGTLVVQRPGYTVTVSSRSSLPSEPVRVSAAETAHDLQLLTSKPGQNGGVPGLKHVTVGVCGNDPRQGAVCPNPPWINTGSGAAVGFGIIKQATDHATQTLAPPRTIIRR